MLKRNWANWFEIPVLDFERARKFYEAVFQIELKINDFRNFKMGIFPHNEVGCAIVFGEWYKPSEQGTTVYLNANRYMQDVVDRIEPAGGKIIQAKKLISPDHGFMALFTDSEGNRLALHSEN